MTSRRDPSDRDGLDRLVSGQRRRHLVAQFMTARRWAQALDDLVVRGVSPTGYGPPLTPLPPARATALLRPVRALMTHLREFVAEQAPAELAAAERRRSEGHTALWARNLLERLTDMVEEAAADVLHADPSVASRVSAERLVRDTRSLSERARRTLEEPGA